MTVWPQRYLPGTSGHATPTFLGILHIRPLLAPHLLLTPPRYFSQQSSFPDMQCGWELSQALSISEGQFSPTVRLVSLLCLYNGLWSLGTMPSYPGVRANNSCLFLFLPWACIGSPMKFPAPSESFQRGNHLQSRDEWHVYG